MFWMMIVARGIAGFGAGGEYPVCATSATEAADETAHLRKRRGFLVAATTDFAIDLVSTSTNWMKALLTLPQGFVAAGLVALIVLACYGQQNSEGVWRVTFGLGIAVSHFLIKLMINDSHTGISCHYRSVSSAFGWSTLLNTESMLSSRSIPMV